jgi:hypothetical protein
MDAAAANRFCRTLAAATVLLFATLASACPACAARDAGPGGARSVLAVLAMMLAPPLVVSVSAFALWRSRRRR